MSSKLSVEDVLANLEERATFHREQEALHAQQETHHRDQRALHAAELEKVLQSLETFRTAASTAVDLAQTVTRKTVPATEEPRLPPPGRLMAGRLVRMVAESPDLAEPFVPATVAAEVNRRFASQLEEARQLASGLGHPAPDARRGQAQARPQRDCVQRGAVRAAVTVREPPPGHKCPGYVKEAG